MNVSKFLFSLFFKTNLSAFRLAILTNDTNRICRILDSHHNHITKELDSAGNTALLLAIKYASPLTVRILLEQGAHPDQSNCLDFQTPLGFLASITYEENQSHEAKIVLEMSIILLDHGAYVDKPSPYTFTDENGKDYTIQETPLMAAVRTKNLPMATLFVERKASVNCIENQTGNRPIHFSITNGDTAMFDLLENAGAACRSVITNGQNTLLHWFCYNKSNDEHMSLLQKLINKGCDINAENNRGLTPLMLATKLNMINTCNLLLNASADIDKVDYEGNRAIDLAEMNSECFKLLQQTKRIHSQQNRKKDHVLRRKQTSSTRLLSKQKSQSINSVDIDENKWKRHSSSTIENQLCNESDREEFDTKYKRMWDKLLQAKQKIHRTREISLPRSKESSQLRKRDLSQPVTRDLYQENNTLIVKL